MSKKNKKILKNNNNLAIAYYRYSSHSQNELSIDQQRAQAQKYAETHGLQIVREYEDKALTGTNDDRPGFQQMLSDVGKIKPAALILWKTDRLGRDRYDLAIAKKKIRDAGCEIHYIAEALPTSTPEASLMEGLLESMAEFYSKQLSQNVLRGMNYNAQNALYNGHKMLGYGVGDDKKYIIDPETAPVVQKIFTDYASGKPIKKIVKELNKQGVKTMLGKNFTINSLRHILKNRAYIGEYHFADTVIPGGMPALVSKETFDEAQKRFEQNKHKARSDEDNRVNFWLTGKLVCGECGSSMHGISGTSKQGTKHYYYACKENRKHKCPLKAEQKELVEDQAIKALNILLCDSEMIASLAVDLHYYYEENYNNNGYIDSLNAQLNETEKSIANLIKAIEMGIFSESTQTRLQELETQKKALTESIEVEKAKMSIIEDDHSIYKFFHQYYAADLSDPEVRDLVFNYFVDKVILYDGEIIITCRFDDKEYTMNYEDLLDAIRESRCKKKNSVRQGHGQGDQKSRQCSGLRPECWRDFFVETQT